MPDCTTDTVSPNVPAAPLRVPPPIMPVLKNTAAPSPVVATPPVASPAPDAERRAAEAIALVESESFRREVRRQDAEMAGDLSVLLQKPVAKIFLSVVVAILVITLRFYRAQYRAARFQQEESAPVAPPPAMAPVPAPAQPYAPPPTYAQPAQPQYFTPATRIQPGEASNPNLPINRYRNAPGSIDPRRLPGMPTPPDPYSSERQPVSVYHVPPGATDAQIIDGAMARMRQEEAARQAASLPPVQAQSVEPQQQPSEPQQNFPPEQSPQYPPPAPGEIGSGNADIPRF